MLLLMVLIMFAILGLFKLVVCFGLLACVYLAGVFGWGLLPVVLLYVCFCWPLAAQSILVLSAAPVSSALPVGW